MDDNDDPIKKLLEQTGWSFTEVLQKLETYKKKGNVPVANKEPCESYCMNIKIEVNDDGNESINNHSDEVIVVDSDEDEIISVKQLNSDELKVQKRGDANLPNNSREKSSITNFDGTISLNEGSIESKANDSEGDIIILNTVDKNNCNNNELIPNENAADTVQSNIEVLHTENETKDNNNSNSDENLIKISTVTTLNNSDEQIKSSKKCDKPSKDLSINNKVCLNSDNNVIIVQEETINMSNKTIDSESNAGFTSEESDVKEDSTFKTKSNELDLTHLTSSDAFNNTKEEISNFSHTPNANDCILKTTQTYNFSKRKRCRTIRKLMNDHNTTANISKELKEPPKKILKLEKSSKNQPSDQNKKSTTSNSKKPKKILKLTKKNIKSKYKIGNQRLRLLNKYKYIFKSDEKRKVKTVKIEDKPVEDIQAKLIEQLNILRNRQKSTNDVNSSSKSSDYNTSRLNRITDILLKKLNKVATVPENEDNLKTENEIENGFHDEESNSSSASNLLIVNVIGGYKSPPPEPDISNEDDDDYYLRDMPLLVEQKSTSIKPTKTKDVTKIKGWKNKKFHVSNEDKNSSSKEEDDLPPPKLTKITNSKILNPPFTESVNTKSAFVSDALDQFLTENAQLNISYEIPKLDAEQTITKKYIDIKFPVTAKESIKQSSSKDKNGYKPKTLAEKRKMLSESEPRRVNVFLSNMNASERKRYEDKVVQMQKKLIAEDVPFTRRCFTTSNGVSNRNSYVFYNGAQLKVLSKIQKLVLARINHTPLYKQNTVNKSLNNKKISLLKSMSPKKKMIFNPNEWATIDVKLPKVFLEVFPQFGKMLHPKVEHLLATDEVLLSKERVKFALSALKVKNSSNPPVTPCKFLLKYKNNERFIKLRKRLIPHIKKEAESDINKAVKTVVDDLLNYVETAELTKNIEKYDKSYKNNQTSNAVGGKSTNLKITENLRCKLIQSSKRNIKTTLEMKRLNCKIVNVSIDEDSNDTKLCAKEFCKLGCVCKSIECNNLSLLLASNCGLLQCMFNCTCNFKNKMERFALPAGTDIFSECVINRLEDEAKKNLAKVEKEFTQTLIRTNNQLIMVGDSDKRRRRITKAPRKYDDYFEKNFEETSAIKSVKKPHNELVPCKYEGDVQDLKPCSVKLKKYNELNNIIPYCMVHWLYKCHCKYEATFSGNNNIISCSPYDSSRNSPERSSPKPTSNKRIKRSLNREDHSARTKGLATQYYLSRNKTGNHVRKIHTNTKNLQKALEAYLRQNADKIIKEYDNPALAKEIVCGNKNKSPKNNKHKINASAPQINIPNLSSQKQDEDLNREPKIQRRKFKINTKIQNNEFISISRAIEETVTKQLDDPQKVKPEMIDLFSKHSSQLRLLSWKILASRFESKTFFLWYDNKSYDSQVLITEHNKCPSIHHFNINVFKCWIDFSGLKCCIIPHLLNKTIPLGKSEDDILLILAFLRGSWSICGLCIKEESSSINSSSSISISLIETYGNPKNFINPTEDEKVEDETLKKVDDEKITNDKETVEPMVHENLQANKKLMFCSKRRFKAKKLICNTTEGNVLKVKRVLWAPVPNANAPCKWRVISMDISFAYLALSRSNYTIKYEDIMKAVKLANTGRTTVLLKSDELQRNYKHKFFGIYCVHNYTDKILVGPYWATEDHDLETLNYVNNVLVNTSLLNQIKGKPTPGVGYWYFQESIDDEVVIVNDSPPLIDLTCDSDDEQKSNKSTPNEISLPNEQDLFKHIPPPDSSDNDEETAKAEKVLDTLLKAGQLNLSNAFLKNLTENLKTFSELNYVIQIDNESPKSSKSLDQSHQNKLTVPTVNVVQTVDDDVEILESVVVGKKYLITNIPKLGYLNAYQHSTYVDVTCPITRRIKQFPNINLAKDVLERVLARRFILVPSTFKLKVSVTDSIPENSQVLNRSLLDGLHIIGEFGVVHSLTSSKSEFKKLGFSPNEIQRILAQREQKLMIPLITELSKLLRIPIRYTSLGSSLHNLFAGAVKEVEFLTKNTENLLLEKNDLENKKAALLESCTKLISSLPLEKRAKEEKKINRIKSLTKSGELSELEKLMGVKSNTNSDNVEFIEIKDSSSSPPMKKAKTAIKSGLPQLMPIPKRKSKYTSIIKTVSNTIGDKTEQKLQIRDRSILKQNSPTDSNQDNKIINKLVVVTQKKNSPCRITPVKDTPLVVQRDLLKSMKGNIIQQQHSKIREISSRSVIKSQSTTVLPTTSSISTLSNLPLVNVNDNNVKQNLTSLASLAPLTKLSFSNSLQPAVLSTVPENNVKNSFSSVTSLTKCVVNLQGTAAPSLTSVPITASPVSYNPNYIAIKDGDNLKYFKLVSEAKLPIQSTLKRLTLNSKLTSPKRLLLPNILSSRKPAQQ